MPSLRFPLRLWLPLRVTDTGWFSYRSPPSGSLRLLRPLRFVRSEGISSSSCCPNTARNVVWASMSLSLATSSGIAPRPFRRGGQSQSESVHPDRHGRRRVLDLQRGGRSRARRISTGFQGRHGDRPRLFRSGSRHHCPGPSWTGSGTTGARAHLRCDQGLLDLAPKTARRVCDDGTDQEGPVTCVGEPSVLPASVSLSLAMSISNLPAAGVAIFMVSLTTWAWTSVQTPARSEPPESRIWTSLS